MKLISSSAPSCSLEGRLLQQRVTRIADLHAWALVSQQRAGRRLVLKYAKGSIREVAAMMAREKDCCDFLDFKIGKTSESITLTITVPGEKADRADVLLAPYVTGHAQTMTSCCGGCQ